MRALSLFALSACSKMLGAMDDVQLLDAAVDGDTTPPAIADFSSSRSVPVAGETLSITLTLDKAAPESGQMITLDVDPDVIAAPVQLTIPAAESSTRFDAYPLRPSARFTIRAHAGESTKELELRIGGLEVAEVLADPAGADDRLQWVKLHNRTSLPIDLLNYRLKAGQASYNFTDMVLVGVIPAGGCFVFGGPVVSALNGDPTFSYAVDFTPDLPHGGTQATGVAVFDRNAAPVNGVVTPVDTMLIGRSNAAQLLGPDAEIATPYCGTPIAGTSALRTGGSTCVQAQLQPNVCN